MCGCSRSCTDRQGDCGCPCTCEVFHVHAWLAGSCPSVPSCAHGPPWGILLATVNRCGSWVCLVSCLAGCCVPVCLSHVTCALGYSVWVQIAVATPCTRWTCSLSPAGCSCCSCAACHTHRNVCSYRALLWQGACTVFPVCRHPVCLRLVKKTVCDGLLSKAAR